MRAGALAPLIASREPWGVVGNQEACGWVDRCEGTASLLNWPELQELT